MEEFGEEVVKNLIEMDVFLDEIPTSRVQVEDILGKGDDLKI